MTATESVVVNAKTQLRTEARERRSAALARHGSSAAERIAAVAAGFLASTPGITVAAFASMADELDTTPLLARLTHDGFRLALPVMQDRRSPLAFRLWQPGDAMAVAKWGIREPLPERPAVEPDVLLVPLLAFDRRGYRLGYGGGYYDRTIAALRRQKSIVAAGLALDEQEVDAVPHLDYDERLDWVLTPSGPLDLRG